VADVGREPPFVIVTVVSKAALPRAEHRFGVR
jgi:hypothetical protein